MQGPPPKAAGLRLRTGLWLLSLYHPQPSPTRLLGALAAAGMNLPVVCWQPDGNGLFAVLESERLDEAEGLARSVGARIVFSRGPVAALSCFPLDRAGLMMPTALAALAAAGVKPWALATSLSALIMLVHEDAAQGGIEALTGALNPPPGSCPANEAVSVTQLAPGAPRPAGETVAMYAEHPVRCYGLSVLPGYVLSCGEAPRPAAAGPGRPAGFAFALDGADGLRFTLCMRPGPGCDGAPASLIHLQGPHYGDRWGIAHAACRGLDEAGVRPLAAAGAAHSFFLAVSPEEADNALTGLARYFCGPAGRTA